MTTLSQRSHFRGTDNTYREVRRVTEHAVQLGRERLNPTLRNPHFLVLRERRRIVSKWLQSLPGRRLSVLDVGGRIQPYRPLMEGRLERYIAVDPRFTGLLDALAVGEDLPFSCERFDLVICTQVLGYATDPSRVIAEIHRVLKPGGVLLLTVPAFSPRRQDERWRFLPDGLRVLLSRFSDVEIVSEGCSVSGIFRTINACVDLSSENERLRRVLAWTLIPLMNICGLALDKLSRGNDQLTPNHSVLARKPAYGNVGV